MTSAKGICLLIFLLLTAAIIFPFRLDQHLLTQAQAWHSRTKKIRRFRGEKKLVRNVRSLFQRCRQLVQQSEMPPAAYLALTALCAAGGFFAGKMIFSALLIALAVGVVGLIAPLLFFGFRETQRKSAMLERLASSMMILSNSYIVTDDFLISVRDNLSILDAPEPFADFLSYVTYMDSSIAAGLRRMGDQVDNPYFSQWVDALVLAQEDRALKYAAVAVVDTMHDVLQVQAESEAAMFAVWRDYLLTLILIFSVPLVFKFVMADAYVTMTTSPIGQGMFVLLLGAVIFSVLRALKINRPLMQ